MEGRPSWENKSPGDDYQRAHMSTNQYAKKQANNTSKNAMEGFLPNNKIAVFLSS